jgi:GNAT superfamily N-acetyltransferase
MDAILAEYFAATAAKVGIPALDMDWDFYAEAAQQGKFILITARENEELVGFVTYYVNNHPHHKTVMYAACDILAVKMAHRGKGIGTQLVKAAEPLLKMFYVKRIVHASRTVYDVEPLFPKLGYSLVERSYMKVI